MASFVKLSDTDMKPQRNRNTQSESVSLSCLSYLTAVDQKIWLAIMSFMTWLLLFSYFIYKWSSEDRLSTCQMCFFNANIEGVYDLKNLCLLVIAIILFGKMLKCVLNMYSSSE